MRFVLMWLAAICCSVSSPAWAVAFYDITFDVSGTQWRDDDPSPFNQPVVSNFSYNGFHILLVPDDDHYIQPDCISSNCYEGNRLAAKIIGSTIDFRLVGFFYAGYGTYGLSLSFDHDLGGVMPENASGFLGGNFTYFRSTPLYSVSLLRSGNIANLQIYTPNNAVPEPATWAMMVLGFGLIGAAMRRRLTVSPSQQF